MATPQLLELRPKLTALSIARVFFTLNVLLERRAISGRPTNTKNIHNLLACVLLRSHR